MSYLPALHELICDVHSRLEAILCATDRDDQPAFTAAVREWDCWKTRFTVRECMAMGAPVADLRLPPPLPGDGLLIRRARAELNGLCSRSSCAGEYTRLSGELEELRQAWTCVGTGTAETPADLREKPNYGQLKDVERRAHTFRIRLGDAVTFFGIKPPSEASQGTDKSGEGRAGDPQAAPAPPPTGAKQGERGKPAAAAPAVAPDTVLAPDEFLFGEGMVGSGFTPQNLLILRALAEAGRSGVKLSDLPGKIYKKADSKGTKATEQALARLNEKLQKLTSKSSHIRFLAITTNRSVVLEELV